MILYIDPLKSVGVFNLGDSVEQIKSKKSANTANEDTTSLGTTLLYKECGLGFYLKNNKCLNISCFAPAMPKFQDLLLLTLPYKSVIEYFQKEQEIYEDEERLLLLQKGIEFSFVKKDNTLVVDSVHISTYEYCFEYLHLYQKVK